MTTRRRFSSIKAGASAHTAPARPRRHRAVVAVVLATLLCSVGVMVPSPAQATSTSWRLTTNLSPGRMDHTAVLLDAPAACGEDCGKVLVAGGAVAKQLSTNRPCSDLRINPLESEIRRCVEAVKTGDASGVVQPFATRQAWLYDQMGTWTRSGDLAVARARHTATRLTDGRVLVAGGAVERVGCGNYPNTFCAVPTASAEIYDPRTRTWSATRPLGIARHSHAATLLPTGEVLVTGGVVAQLEGMTTSQRPMATATAELYNPGTGTWKPAAPLYLARFSHSATLLAGTGCAGTGTSPHCGDVVVAGGYYNGGRYYDAIGQNPTSSAEVYDRGISAGGGSWSVTAALSFARAQHTATLLPDGKVLVAGGDHVGYTRQAEVFNPLSTPASHALCATKSPTIESPLLYVPGGDPGLVTSLPRVPGTWSCTQPMAVNHGYGAAAALLPGGRVMVAGGALGSDPGLYDLGGSMGTAEIYSMATGTWETTKALNHPRRSFTLTAWPGGVLAVGGISNDTSSCGLPNQPPCPPIAETEAYDIGALVVNASSVTEGDTGTSSATFTVSLSEAKDQTVTVNYATADGTAAAPGDYASTTGSLSFAPGETAKTITVAVATDAAIEGDETFLVKLSGAAGAAIAHGQAAGTIVDDDGTVFVSDAAPVTEGTPGIAGHTQGMARFTVSLSAPATKSVSLRYATTNGSASAPSDYPSTSGTLTFAVGEVAKDVRVPIAMDTSREGDEHLFLDVPTTTTGDERGRATIVDDDPASTATLSVTDVTVSEGVAGTTTQAVFTVSLSRPWAGTFTVRAVTSDGTAHPPPHESNDYVHLNQVLTFAREETTKQVAVTINGDNVDERDETFFLALEDSTGPQREKRQGVGVISNEDGHPTISINDTAHNEGNSHIYVPGSGEALFTVSLSYPSNQEIRVNYATVDGTARSTDHSILGPADYNPAVGVLSFAPGETAKTLGVVLKGDRIREPDEDFFVQLSNSVNATQVKRVGRGTIVNDEMN